MPSVTVTVTNETGLHSRPADLFVRTAKLYEAKITVHKREWSADGKTIIKLLLLNVTRGTEITIDADGPDAEEALKDLERLVTSDFTEVNPAVSL